jgi:hypothetical protein
MKFYFAAAYQRHVEMTRYANALEMSTDGQVVSTWHREVTPGLDASFDATFLAEHTAEAWEHGKRDIADLGTADAIVSFTDGAPARGGRHVEHGVAMNIAEERAYLGDAPMRLIVIGPREHVFHCHPATEVYPDFVWFLRHETAEDPMRADR